MRHTNTLTVGQDISCIMKSNTVKQYRPFYINLRVRRKRGSVVLTLREGSIGLRKYVFVLVSKRSDTELY